MSRFNSELKVLLTLSWPLLLGQVSQTLMGLADTLMAGQVSAQDLAAVSIGAGLWIPLMLAIGGLLMALTPLVAGHHGAGEAEQVAPWLNQALWLALPLGIFAGWLLRQSLPLLQWLQVEPTLLQPTLDYLYGISWGMPAFALFQVFRCCADGLSHPKAGMWVNFLGLAANVGFNWVFIYGHWGAPALGGPGCGVATSLAFWLMALVMAGYLAKSARLAEFDLYRAGFAPQPARLGKLLQIGMPIALSIFIEVSLFTLVSLFLARLGAVAVAAHQIALSLSSVVFMLPLSLGLALCIRIGFLLGSQQTQSLSIACRAALWLALLQASLSCLLSWYFAPQIVGLYSRDAAVIALALPLVHIAALYQIPDALQVVASGALRGFRDTLVALLISLIAFWGVGMSLGYSLAFSDFWGEPLGPRGMWTGICIGLCVAAVLFGARLRWRLRQAQASL